MLAYASMQKFPITLGLVCLLCSGFFQVLLAPKASAQIQLDPGFDPNYVLTDDDVFDVYGMTYNQLRDFLKSKGGLGDLMVKDIDGQYKLATDVIWRVANSYKINPKYLLALLQKEQSLVEGSTPSQNQLDWATGFAVCDSCSKNDPSIQGFKGFANQLEWAAKQHREKYLIQLLANGQTISGKKVGKSVLIDGLEVTPANQATAMLYTYTPHLHGNLNLWRIWKRWFSLVYPNGSVVRGKPSGKTYLIYMGEKREFATPDVLASMTDPDKIIETSDTDLTAYPDGEAMLFPKYSLLRTEDGSLYLLVSDGKRKIASMSVFRKLGFVEDEIVDVKLSEIADIPDLDPITSASAYPQGALIKVASISTVWYVENSVKHAIPDGIFLNLYFTGRPIKYVTKKTLASFTTGDPYQLHSSELVRGKSSPAVYVVENSKIRPIPSADIFEELGWKWHNVVTVPDRVIAMYDQGDPFTLQSMVQDSTSTDLTASSTLQTTSGTVSITD